MKHTIEINGTETEVTMTRADVLAAHNRMRHDHAAGMALLDSIHSEIPEYSTYAAEAEAENRVNAELDAEAGLTTEINTSRSLVSLEDTVRGIVEVLTRHPHGFKGDGTRRENGTLKGTFKAYTPEENEAADKWAAGPKLGSEWAKTGRLSTDCWTGGE